MKISKETKAFGGFEFFACASFCIGFYFIIMYFKHLGYAESHIGIILAVTNILTIIAQPIFGYLSDNVISVKTILGINIIISIVMALLFPFFEESFIIVFLIFMILCISEKPIISMMDSYITKLSVKRSGLNYGVARGLGSLGFAITALLAGYIIDKFGYTSMFFIHALLLIVAFLILIRLEDVPPVKNRKEKSEKQGITKDFSELLKNKKYVITTLAVAISFLGTSGASIYYPMLVSHVGGTNFHVGVSLFIQAFSEVPIMFLYNSIRRRFGDEKLLLFSICVFAVKFFGVTVFQNLGGVLMMQFLQSISFGLLMPSVLRCISKAVPERLTATAIMVSCSIYAGLSAIISNLMGGFLIESYGIFTIYYVSAVCSTLGALLLLTTFRNSKNKSLK